MIARVAAMAGVLIVALLVDTVVTPSLSLGVWEPDLVMMTVLAVALAEGPGAGVRYGFVAGLVVDLLSTGGRLVATSALVLLLAGYALGALRPYLAGGGLPARVVAVAGATVLVVFARTLLDQLLDPSSSGPGLANTAQLAFATAASHALLTPVVLVPLGVLGRLLPSASGAERGQSVWQRGSAPSSRPPGR